MYKLIGNPYPATHAKKNQANDQFSRFQIPIDS